MTAGDPNYRWIGAPTVALATFVAGMVLGILFGYHQTQIALYGFAIGVMVQFFAERGGLWD